LGLDRDLSVLPLKALRVCVFMKPPENPYYELLARGFREANLLLAPQAVTAYVNHIDILSPDAILSALRMTPSCYDALVIVAPSRQSTVDALLSVKQQLPVITLATDLPLEARHYYVGPNNYQAGRVAGELMGRLLGPTGGNVLLVAGLSEFVGHNERKNGFQAILRSDFPACRIAGIIENLDRNELAADAVIQFLRADPSIRGIYNISQGNDDITARIDDENITAEIVFICHDLTQTTVALLRERRLDVVIDQDPILEARIAMETVLHHFGRWAGSCPKTDTPIRVYFRENLTHAAP
jgi:LacI family transcriptional regulator